VAAGSDHPTILIVHEDRKFRAALRGNLQAKGYLILEAQDAAEALKIVVQHSRRIPLLLTDDSDDSRTMAAILQPFRPDMNVVHLRLNVEANSALIEVSKVIESLAGGFENQESSLAKVRPALEADAEEARRHFLDSTGKFLEAAKDVSSGMRGRDSLTRIQRLTNAVQRAFEEYLQARKKLEIHVPVADSRIKSKQKKKRNK
jgi:DNA-binding NtrC family response regulator